jgi:hypothetical protein
MTEDINTDLFEKILAHIQDILYRYNIRKISFYMFFDSYNSYKKDITDEQKCELFIPFVKYISSIGICINIPTNFDDIILFLCNILNNHKIAFFNYFCKLFMSNYCITLYTPKYFYDNLEQYILSEEIYEYDNLLIIIKAFIDYKYIPINLILPNIHKYITYLKLIKTDNEKELIPERFNIFGFYIEESPQQLYSEYITDIEAITNELYFACSYRYLWIGAVIRGIFCKYSCFGLLIIIKLLIKLLIIYFLYIFYIFF